MPVVTISSLPNPLKPTCCPGWKILDYIIIHDKEPTVLPMDRVVWIKTDLAGLPDGVFFLGLDGKWNSL